MQLAGFCVALEGAARRADSVLVTRASQLWQADRSSGCPVQGGWQNRILARAVNEMASYNPIWRVPAIKAPVLLMPATNDTLCPIAVARRAATLNSLIRCAWGPGQREEIAHPLTTVAQGT